MKITVRHSDRDAEKRLRIHAEKILQRVFDESSLSIHQIVLKLKASADAEAHRACRCTLTVKLVSDEWVQADACDAEGILAVYRAVDKVKVLLAQRSRTLRKNAKRKSLPGTSPGRRPVF